MSEVVGTLPLFDQVTQSIKENGSFQRGLTAPEVGNIMNGVVEGLLTGQDRVKVSVPQMDVQIENQRGVVSGSVQVEKPIKATIGINFVLGNDESDPKRIRLVNLQVNEKAGFAAKMALKAVNVEGKARQALQDPNQALLSALASQLKPKGIKLTGIGLHFTDDRLGIELKGRQASRG
ncbi:hypothetical protein IID22_03465 [Patescibacteria group bacterium]|nr:hypothetical protein [Patescibacteria group bacterium]